MCSNLKYFKYVEFNGDFFFQVGNTLFELNFSKNPKLPVQAEIWYLNSFEDAKLDGDVHFFVLDPFLEVLFKNPICNFDVTWLIQAAVYSERLKASGLSCFN